MSGYITILFLSIIPFFINFINEKNVSFKNKNLLSLYRFIHLYFFIYFTFFLLFFKISDKTNIIIYLIITFLTISHWQYYGCCLLSLFEYNEYISSTPVKMQLTNKHPSILSISKTHHDLIMTILGAFMFINIYCILYFSKYIKFPIKIILFVIYTFLIILTLTTRENQFYNEKLLNYFNIL